MIYRPYELYQSFSNFVPPMGLDIWLKFYGHPSSSVQDFRGMLLPPPPLYAIKLSEKADAINCGRIYGWYTASPLISGS